MGSLGTGNDPPTCAAIAPLTSRRRTGRLFDRGCTACLRRVVIGPRSDGGKRIGYRATDTWELHHLYRAMASWGRTAQRPAGARVLETPRCTKDWNREELFEQRRDLFSEIDLVFFDTTSLYCRRRGRPGDFGRYGQSKDHRPDLKQMWWGWRGPARLAAVL